MYRFAIPRSIYVHYLLLFDCLMFRLLDLGGIFQGIGGRHPRGPHLGQMARVVPVYPLIIPVNRPFYWAPKL